MSDGNRSRRAKAKPRRQDYGEACPISKAVMILGERWTIPIIREMMLGAERFSEFQKLMPRLSPSLLNTRLKSLEDHGLVFKKRIPEQRGYSYHLTASGKALRPMMMELGKWGMRFAFDSVRDEDLNAYTILRDIAVKLKHEELPGGDFIMRFTLTDLPPDNQVYFIPVRDGTAFVCDQNPGHEIDVYITSDTRTLTEIWYGRTSISAAKKNGCFDIVGLPVYTRHVSRWFPVSVFAND